VKLLLADPPALERNYDNSYPNLGILYLLSHVRDSFGAALELKYLESFVTLEEHLRSVADFEPHIYGISFTSKTSSLAYRTIDAIKTRFPEIVVLAGGPHVTAMPEEVLQISKADICVIGEGEQTLSQILESKLNGRSRLEEVPGIAYRQGERTVRTQRREFITNLDDIPFPAREFVQDPTLYHGNFLRRQKLEASVLTSRGCPFNCCFCSNPVWKSAKPWLRQRSVRNILEEIQNLYENGVREIYFSSDEINFNEKWAIELFEEIRAKNHGDLFLQCNLRADKISSELVRAMKEANCWLVHMGMESGNDRVLRGIGKNITVKQIREAVSLLSDAQIRVFAFMMLYNVWEEDGRLKHESSLEVDNSINLCMEFYRKRQIHYMSWQFCTPMPGSRLFPIASKYNLFRQAPSKTWERYDEHDVTMRLPGISLRQMKWRNRKGILLKDWYLLRSGSVNWRHLWRIRENLAALFR
jgi:anaerobic magnesium-protoporphyrin IX monomethyl ester cyclase